MKYVFPAFLSYVSLGLRWVSFQFSSVARLCLTLWPHEPQHTRPLCASPTAGVYSNPCPLSQWCHPTISSSVIPFSSCPQSFPASGSFPMSQLFTSGGQSIGVSASTSVFPMIFGSCFCIHSATLCLLVESLNPLHLSWLLISMIPFPFTLLFWIRIYKPFLCFLSREDPLAFFEQPLCWHWIHSVFAYW